jgi:hypothetical protein
MEVPGVDERKYYNVSSRNKLESLEWIDRHSCRAIMNEVMNVWVT